MHTDETESGGLCHQVVRIEPLIPEALADASPALKLVYIPLYWYPPLRPRDLTHILSHNVRTVRYALKELKELGVVSDTHSLHDGRATFYTTSEKVPDYVKSDVGPLPRFFPGELADLRIVEKLVYLAVAIEGPITLSRIQELIRHSPHSVEQAVQDLCLDRAVLQRSQTDDGRIYQYALVDGVETPTLPPT